MPDFRYIVHRNLQDEELKAICAVKSLAFPYDIASQESWIRKNITAGDIHLLYEPGGLILAYLNIVEITFDIDEIPVGGYGIGNVCSREKGKGYGLKIMSEINRFLSENKKPGLLFCKTALVPFYLKAGWSKAGMTDDLPSIPGRHVETMVYNIHSSAKINYSGKVF